MKDFFVFFLRNNLQNRFVAVCLQYQKRNNDTKHHENTTYSIRTRC